MYKPFHLIGLELSISVLNAALRGEATGATRTWRGVATVAKRALKAGEMLDGEGGYTVYGNKLIPTARSLAERALPLGLAHKVRLVSDIAAGALVRWSDVAIDAGALGVRVRRDAEAIGRAKAA